MTQHGFKQIALDLVRQYPGQTPEEYAKMALDRGLCASDSKKPILSLSTTMRKEYREGRMPDIRSARVDGKLRFFPKNHLVNQRDIPFRPNVAITVVLPPEDSEIIDMLVEIGRFNNRSEALSWLVREGIKNKEGELNQARDVLNKIRQLKKSVPLIDTPNSVLKKILPPQMPQGISKPLDAISIELNNLHSPTSFALIPIPKQYRYFLPGYKSSFTLETDIGPINTWVTSAPKGTPIGDPEGGTIIQGGLRAWFDKHNELAVGDKLKIETLETGKRYQLSIIHELKDKRYWD